MRIERLDLKRFGCFTDCTLDLSGPGLHVVVGLNEAGKTTGMTAIRQLLFGIPLRSPHAFVHEMRDLRVGALLRDDGGDLHEVTRVKRQADTLRGPQDEILDEAVLARVRHDIDEVVYTSLFSIGHDEIARGGEALLGSDGELGKALFSASRGTTDLTAVLRKLDERASALFKSSASIPKLNAAIRDYRDGVAAAKQLSKSASEVVGLDGQLRAAQDDYDRTVADRKELARRRTQLDRIRAARPQLAARQDCFSQKVELERTGVLIDPAVGVLLDEAQQQRSDGETRCRSAQAAVDRLKRKLGELSIDSALLAQRDVIDQLQADSGGYRQNIKDLPGLVARAGSLERDFEELRRRLPDGCPLDADGQSALSVAQEERIRQLAGSRAKLEAQLEHATEQMAETTASIDSLRSDLAAIDAPADVKSLVEVAARVRKAGDLEAVRTDTARRLETIDAAVANAMVALGLSDVDPRAVDAVAVPAVETIRQIRGELDKLTGSLVGFEELLADLDSQHNATQGELAELLSSEHPPRETDLVDARTRRDDGWRLIRAMWLDGSVDPGAVQRWANDLSLENAYEAAVGEADEVADRLRDEANAVQRRASLEAKLDDIDDRLAAIRSQLDAVRAERADAESSWVQMWAKVGIVTGSPGAMEHWRDDFRDCAQHCVEARRLAADIAGLDDTIGRHRKDLVLSLRLLAHEPPEAMSLAGLLDLAERVAAVAAAARQEQAGLASSCADAEKLLRRHVDAHAKAEEAMALWRQDWTEAVTTLGLDKTASPNEATAVLKVLGEIAGTGRDLGDMRRRISGIERRNANFTRRVAEALSKLDGHGDLADISPEVAITTLARRLGATQEAAAEHRTTTEELDSHDQDRGEAALKVAEADERISQMVRSAGLADETQLGEAIARSKDHSAVVERIARLEEDLRQATGLSVDEVESEAAEMSGVEIDPEIDELVRTIEGMDETLKAQGKAVGELAAMRSLIDASGEAADAMSRAQQSLAAAAAYADEYVQVVLAKQLLDEQVRLYRDEHQGPLLARARELFRELTVGRYIGLDTDTDDKGNPYLLARTAADKLLEVGALSTGTRDQLYLALRLAALEQFIDRRGPLPLVLDDLFVHFDDERTAAGLAVLDGIAHQAQVLLFTHHEQVARQAADVIDQARLSVHHLG